MQACIVHGQGPGHDHASNAPRVPSPRVCCHSRFKLPRTAGNRLHIICFFFPIHCVVIAAICPDLKWQFFHMRIADRRHRCLLGYAAPSCHWLSSWLSGQRVLKTMKSIVNFLSVLSPTNAHLNGCRVWFQRALGYWEHQRCVCAHRSDGRPVLLSNLSW